MPRNIRVIGRYSRTEGASSCLPPMDIVPYPHRFFRSLLIFSEKHHTLSSITTRPDVMAVVEISSSSGNHPAISEESPACYVSSSSALTSSHTSVGDGFTNAEVEKALQPAPAPPWRPTIDYTERRIGDLKPGREAVSFMGRVANVFDVPNSPKSPKTAKGCTKLCIKDDQAAITVSEVYHNTQHMLMAHRFDYGTLRSQRIFVSVLWCQFGRSRACTIACRTMELI